jgi:uncharacterized protein
MSGVRAIVGLVAAILLLTNVTHAADALPPLTQPVNDLARVLDEDSIRRMDSLSRALQAATGDVVIVVTVPTIEPYADVRQYAVELFANQGRGIGERSQDNGVLILLALKEGSVWIEVGYGLEPWITDGFAGETSRELMVPEFRSGRYGPGMLAGMSRVVTRIAEGRNITLTGVEQPLARRVPGDGPLPLWVVVLIFVAIVLLSRHAGGPGRTVRRWDRSGWSGWSSGVGPFGGSGWGGGGGFGGFGGVGGGGFGGFGGGRSGGGGGGARW